MRVLLLGAGETEVRGAICFWGVIFFLVYRLETQSLDLVWISSEWSDLGNKRLGKQRKISNM